MKGGKRIGAGRKPLPYKTITLSVKVPTVLHHQISQLIKKTIEQWKQTINSKETES